MKEVVYRGTLTLEKLAELAQKHQVSLTVKDDAVYNPDKNHDAISIIRQADGNWKGQGFFHERLATVRSWSPQAVLDALLTGQSDVIV